MASSMHTTSRIHGPHSLRSSLQPHVVAAAAAAIASSSFQPKQHQQPCQQLQQLLQLRYNHYQQNQNSSSRLVVCRATTLDGDSNHPQQQHQRAVEVSRSIAASRAAESSRPDALFKDPFAAVLSCNTHNTSSNCSSSSSSSNPGGGVDSLHQQQQEQQQAMDVIATKYIDESLLNAMDATSTNSIQAGDYRQVVLLGDGMDTRPFRLLWPPGTLLFSVAPAEVHEQAEALLAAAAAGGGGGGGGREGQQQQQQQQQQQDAQVPVAHVMRGCLLRRVNMNIKPAVMAAAAAAADADSSGSNTSSSSASSSSDNGANGGDSEEVNTTMYQQQPQQQQSSQATVFREQLMRAGFRSDRLSVWALQGLHNQGIGADVMQQLLAEVADSAAFHSLIVGELPGPLSRQSADNLLAEAGLLGAVYDYGAADGGQYKRWQDVLGFADGEQQKTAAAAMPGAAGEEATGAAAALDSNSPSSSGTSSSDVPPPRWVFAAQQLRLSLSQMGIYEDWSSEFEAADFGDDYIGNVS